MGLRINQIVRIKDGLFPIFPCGDETIRKFPYYLATFCFLYKGRKEDKSDLCKLEVLSHDSFFIFFVNRNNNGKVSNMSRINFKKNELKGVLYYFKRESVEDIL